MRVGVISYTLSLLPLHINTELIRARAPLSGPTLYQRDLSVSMLNATTSFATKNSSIAFIDGKDDSESRKISILNMTNSRVNNPSVEEATRRLIEISESTQHGYLTSNCDASNLGNTEAATFDTMLAQVQNNLRMVIQQAQKGPASNYGFSALFKSQANTRKVVAIFQQIMNSTKVGTDSRSGPIAPLTICVGPPANVQTVTGMDELYAACQVYTDRRAMQPRGSNIVLLCPSFWELPGGPSASICPRRNSNGVMAPNEGFLQFNRQAAFIHEMVHLYIGDEAALEKETYKVADAVALSEESSMRNPSNYAFFYSAVIARCTRWPYAPRRAGGDDGGL